MLEDLKDTKTVGSKIGELALRFFSERPPPPIRTHQYELPYF